MNCVSNKICGCNIQVKTIGNDDVTTVKFLGTNKTLLNWTEISVQEMLCLPDLSPDIEYINEVSVSDEVTNVKLIETPFSYNSYRTFLTSSAELTLVKSVVGLIVIPTALITSITTALNAIYTLLIGPANLLPAGNPLSVALAQISGLITSINNAVTSINNAVTDITNLTQPVSVCTLTNLLQSLYNALDLLETTLNTVVALVNTIVSLVSSLLPALTGALNAIVAPLLANITTLVNLILGYLTDVLSLITQLQEPNFFVITPNAENTCLTGRELVIEGVLHQTVIYTANINTHPVHSLSYDIPFSGYIVTYASFEGLSYTENVQVITNPTTCNFITVNGFYFDPNIPIMPDLTENFDVKSYIEHIYIQAIDQDTIFKNVTVFLKATP